MSLQHSVPHTGSAPPRPRWARTRLHAVLGIGGPLVGVVAALVVFLSGGSPLSVVLTLAAVAGILGLALPEVLTGPRRMARVTFALLPVVGSVGGVLVAVSTWENGWIELAAGAVVGSTIGSMLQPLLFPGLARERTARWQRRA